MGKKYMAVCGLEKNYISKLYEYILNACEKDFEVVLFTKEEKLEDFLEKKVIEVAFIEEHFQVKKEKQVKNIIRLSEENDNPDMVYKYMPCDKILKEGMKRCALDNSLSATVEKQSKKLIGVYTPIKRCFQTSFSLTYGQILAKKHKVLYLNFESFSGFETLCKAIGKTDLLDLVYFSECETSNFLYRIESIKEKIGELDYISPIKMYVRYSEISKDQWERLLTNILEKTNYEYVILDLSEQVNGLLSILQKCTKIYTITDSHRISTAKVAQYENLLKESVYGDILEKTENILIPTFREIPSDFELLPYSELAAFMKKIIDFDGED